MPIDRLCFPPLPSKTGDNAAMLRLIHFYQRWVSPLLPPRCRFVPTCSSFAVEAIETHGTTRGGVMALHRICKCHPFHPGGFDPVPTGNTDEADRLSRTSTSQDQSTPPNTQQTLDQ